MSGEWEKVECIEERRAEAERAQWLKRGRVAKTYSWASLFFSSVVGKVDMASEVA